MAPKPPVHKQVTLGQQVGLALIFLLAIIVAGLIAYRLLADWICWAWLVLCFLLFIGYLGKVTIGRWMGIFISDRNVMSLSRMQIIAWTVLIISAFMTMVLVRIAAGTPDAFGIDIDWHLWALLGLSASAAVGAPLINSVKAAKEPAADPNAPAAAATTPANGNGYSPAVNRTATELNEDPGDIDENRKGVLYANKSVDDASFTDIFEGDELANTMYIDVTKVQMFWFSIIAITGYTIMILQMFLITAPADLKSFPVLTDGLIGILAVSHATYLGGKGFTQTKSTG